MTNIPTFLRKPENTIAISLSFAFTALLWWLPQAGLALAVVTTLFTILLAGSRLVYSMTGYELPEPTDPGDDFVSIHIATYSEPPDVVKKTLDSLAHLDHENYEVIVLDNNTPDPALYEPVRSHCRQLGSRFRFYHFDDVKGAKAGALNISLELSDPRTDAILILDADYQARPGILKKGLSYFTDSTVALVQFPQAYRNSRKDCGLTWEYKLFFDLYMKLANRWNTVLSTGTAAFVKKEALIKSGGWSGETLTEDAELGLRLHRHGYRGIYVPEVVAAGLMPTDLKSLKAQRRRWVLGNAQSLVGLMKEKQMKLERRAMMLLQLTAWANPLLISAVFFLVSGAFHVVTGSALCLAIAGLSFVGMLGYLAATMLLFVRVVTREGGTLGTALKAYGVHLGMLGEGAVSWCELFVQSDKSFVRTDKFIHAPEKWAITLSAFSSLLLASLGLNLVWLGGSIPLALGLGLASVWALGVASLRWNLHRIREHTLALESAAEQPVETQFRRTAKVDSEVKVLEHPMSSRR